MKIPKTHLLKRHHSTLYFSPRPAWDLMAKFRSVIALSGVCVFAILSAQAQTEAAAAPPSPPPQLSPADLEKLLMPIALYPDALLATMLPAAVYPLEIVQAARFVTDPNNVAKIDQQPWDESVKAVAKVPAAIKMMNDDLPWTMQLGEAFLNQDKAVMDMVQTLRNKAQKAGTLKTTEQQIIIVTNTVVQIVPANPQVVYVPTYPPTVYAPPPGPPPGLTFAAGVAVGVIMANNCDWHGGGVYYGGGGGNYNGGGNTKVTIEGDVNIGSGNNNKVGSGNRATQNTSGKKWQPDQNRVKASGTPASTKSMESRGYGSGSANTAARASTQPATANRGGSTMASSKPSAQSTANRPSGAGTQASPASASAKPSASSATRPSAGSPSAAPSASAFGGGDKQASQRGSASRGGSGGGGGGRGGR